MTGTVLHSNANQGLLELQLHNIFPNTSIIKNTRKQIEIRNPLTGGFLEVDVWLPGYHLCFEFQDDYHYQPVWYAQMPLATVQHKDNIKRSLLLERSHSLVVVPYWWDGTAKSLQGTIHFNRPDIFIGLTRPLPQISYNPPSLVFQDNKQMMLASFPEDISVITEEQNNKWWVGEKWDGLRCVWEAAEKSLYSRHNLKVGLNATVVDSLGYLVFDVELWCGRGLFHETLSSTVNSQDLDASLLRVVCFDEASRETRALTFETRYSLVLSFLSHDNPVAVIAPRFFCTDDVVMLASLDCVVEGGGEGLILREPQSHYIPGRSKALLKIKKAMQHDQEALVLNTQSDGSLLLQLPNGFQFAVEKQACLLPQRPVRGDIVTFSFDPTLQRSSDSILGPPLNPLVHSVRHDLLWEDSLRSAVRLPFGNELHRFYKVKQQASTQLQFEDKREFLDNFAASKGMDPLNPAFWYKVSTRELSNLHDGNVTIMNSGDKLSTTIMQLYPEIGLQQAKFKINTSWKEESERKAYFDQFAASKGEDPLNPVFWYGVKARDLMDFLKGYKTILKYYGGQLSTALMKLYPNIGLRSRSFAVQEQSWDTASKRRSFFDKFASWKGMDSLNPLFWYNVTREELLKYRKGYVTIANYYGGKLSTALLRLYPNIGLQKSLFKMQRWQTVSVRLAYFDAFAASKGMDPLNPLFWYTVTRDDLSKYHPGYRAILKFYHGKLSTALIQLFPNLGLQKSRFRGNDQPWVYESDRRAFFDKFAESKGEDPHNPSFWYSVTVHELMRFHHGYYAIVRHYGDKLSSALVHIYPDIGLQKSLFTGDKLSWKRESKRKEYFEKFAASHQKKSNDTQFWYNVTRSQLASYHPGYQAILKYYSSSISTALMHLFPNIGLVKSGFKAQDIT